MMEKLSAKPTHISDILDALIKEAVYTHDLKQALDNCRPAIEANRAFYPKQTEIKKPRSQSSPKSSP